MRSFAFSWKKGYDKLNRKDGEESLRKFVESGNLTEEKIRKFSKEQNVKPFIVVGRIQREQKDYKLFYNLKTRYKWE